MTNYKTDDSEWNFALAYFNRLDNAIKVCNLNKFQNNYRAWFDALWILHDELYPQMKSEERVVLEKLKNHSLQLVKAGGNVDVFTMRNALSNYERELRLIMKERGMDMPRKSDPTRALLN